MEVVGVRAGKITIEVGNQCWGRDFQMCVVDRGFQEDSVSSSASSNKYSPQGLTKILG